MRIFIRILLILASSVWLMACSGVSVDHAEGRQPRLTPQGFFKGKLCADGVVRDRSGAEIRQFNAQILASWNADGTGTLDEVFYFYDEAGAEPKEETRVWTLQPVTTEEGLAAYLASATDVPEPVLMTFAGNTLQMKYVLNYVRDNGDTIALNMDDRMFMVAEGVVVNETRMTKFGLDVGQILLVMRQVPAETDCLAR
tara:strand:+ start:969 stop:1562 length:594 start_codon:yes stop_codon:yes gene_type:complete